MTEFRIITDETDVSKVVTREGSRHEIVEFTGTFEECCEYVKSEIQFINQLEENEEHYCPFDSDEDLNQIYVENFYTESLQELKAENASLQEQLKEMYSSTFTQITNLSNQLNSANHEIDRLANIKNDYAARLERIERVLGGVNY